MQAVANPIALELADEVRKAVAPNDFVDDTLKRKNEFEQFRKEVHDYVKWREQKVAQAEKQKGEAVGMEKMLIAAFQSSASHDVIEAMRQTSGITEARLEELKKQALKT